MFSGTPRKQIILRSRGLRSDAFGALFSRMFDNLYADSLALSDDIVISGVYGRHEGVSFRRMHYRGDCSITFGAPQDEITFVLPSAGRVVFEHGVETTGRPGMGLAIDKRTIRALHFADDHAQCGMSIRRGLITERLAILLGRPVLQPIRFEPVVDLGLAAYPGIRALLELATGNEFDPLIHAGVLMPVRLQEMLVDAVLEAWPHNHSEALRRPSPQIAQRHVKLAMDYIRANPHSLTSGAELAALANVSLRALQQGFKRFVGASIVDYQRQVRLERAYEALARGESGSVSEVALRHGFSNAGRFSHYFQQAYGVSPAQVLRGV
ncbi:AraC family transcriptional regulator [Pseudomonas guariconensis]|uniref:helix-turn-helix transcriptional regulator n=1 Tax=Pseudomonas guariconensis TaxID=1288410 RepID=UPI002FE569F7